MYLVSLPYHRYCWNVLIAWSKCRLSMTRPAEIIKFTIGLNGEKYNHRLQVRRAFAVKG